MSSRQGSRSAAWAALVAVAVAACGRFRFDPITNGDAGGDDGNNSDALPVVSPRAITVGHQFACSVFADGSLWCWGDNRTQSLAFAGLQAIVAPTQVGSDVDWTDVATDDHNVCALKANGTLWCMGASVGDGTTAEHASPVQIGTETDWTAIAGGQGITCGLRAGGVAWCWGDNTSGAVGNGAMGGTVTSPAAVMTAQRFASIAVSDHVCAIEMAGTLWCWGFTSGFAIGDGTGNSYAAPVQIGTALWRSVDVHPGTSFGVQADGTLWGWGVLNSPGGNSSAPVQVDATTGWLDVRASHFEMCGHRGTDLWCQGGNQRGELGTGDTLSRYAATQIDPGHVFGQLAMGDAMTCAVRDGVLVCAGSGAHGELGDGVRRWAATPHALAGGPWNTVALGAQNACAIAADSTLWCWGSNEFGGLSQPGSSAAAPIQLGAATWADVKPGQEATIGRRADGSLWYWGQLTGIGLATMPTQIDAANWVSADFRGQHVCGLHADSTAWCVGNGGALGNNSLLSSSVPVQAGNGLYLQVATGGAASYGIQTDRSLWAWGRNVFGQLGDGTPNDRKSPVSIANGTLWSTVAGGDGHACGIQTDGSLWCWGDNTTGQLGDGTVTTRATPTRVGTGTTWRSVAPGAEHTCAIDANAALWCWGANQQGQLGDGTYANRLTPVQIGIGTAWAEVSTGIRDVDGFGFVDDAATTCARDTSGKVSCWGNNVSGLLGDGTGWSPSFRPVVR